MDCDLKEKNSDLCLFASVTSSGDIFTIHGKSAKYTYVDGTPTLVKMHIYRNLISQILMTGQICIDVYSICTFKMTNFVQIL